MIDHTQAWDSNLGPDQDFDYVQSITELSNKNESHFSAAIDECQGKNNCVYDGSMINNAWGDPCSGVEKYTEIVYECVPPCPVQNVCRCEPGLTRYTGEF